MGSAAGSEVLVRDVKWFRLLAVACASVLVFGACGGDDGDDGETAEETATETPIEQEEVPVEQYVADFCGAMVDWQTSIQTLSTDFRENVFLSDLPPDQKRDELATYLSELRGLTEDFISEVEAAGTPDVEGGADVADQFLSGFQQLTGAIEGVEAQVSDLPTDSEEAFTTAAQELVGQIQTSFQTIGDGLTQIESDPIDQAFTEEESCQQIQTAPAQ